MDARLDEAAKLTRLGRSGLALAAIEAVLAAIERDGGVVAPVEFEVTRSPASRDGKERLRWMLNEEDERRDPKAVG